MRVMFKIYLDAFIQVVIFCSNMNLQKERKRGLGLKSFCIFLKSKSI